MKITSALLTAVFMLSAGAGEQNLALGKKVFYSIAPDNPKDLPQSKLTDGKKNARKFAANTDAGTTFDEQRLDYNDVRDDALTVGWHRSTYGREAIGVSVCIDLEKVENLGRCILRAGSFTGAMYRFSLPREFILLVSNDGQNFYRVDTVKKLTSFGHDNIESADRLLKLQENRNRWIDIEFDLSGISARYVGVIVKPEGFMFYLDEFEVFSGAASAGKDVMIPGNRYNFPVGNGLAAQDAIVFKPSHDIFHIPENTFVPTFLSFADYRPAKSKEPYQFVIELPPGATLHRTYLLRNQFNVAEKDGKYVLTPKNTGKHFKRYNGEMLGEYSLGPLYFRATGDIAEGSVAKFYCRVGNTDFSSAVCPVRSLRIPVVENKLPGMYAITWMLDYYSLDWPEFYKSYTALGFNSMPFFPRYWSTMSDLPEAPFKPVQYIGEAHRNNLKIIQNESPLHTIKEKKETACMYEGAKGFCPSYRGEFYQNHLRELSDNFRALQADYLIWDIELMNQSIGGKAQNILKCERCADAVAKSGKTPEEYLLDCGEEILRDLYNAAAAQIKHPFLTGQYDVFAGQKSYHHLWKFDRAYPKYLQLSMPAAYTAGLFNINHRIAQNDYSLLGQKWISTVWVTPGTYGYCSPHKMEAMVYEQALNGGNLCIYSFNNFTTPLQMFYLTRGLSNICRYPQLFESGKPEIDFAVDNPELTCSRFGNDKETLIFVANYSSPNNETFTFELTKGSLRLDREEKLAAGKQRITLRPAEFILLYCPK